MKLSQETIDSSPYEDSKKTFAEKSPLPATEFAIFSSEKLSLIPGLTQKGLILPGETIQDAVSRFLQSFTVEELTQQVIANRKKAGYYTQSSDSDLTKRLAHVTLWYGHRIQALKPIIDRLEPFTTSADQKHMLLLILFIHGDCEELQTVQSTELLQIALSKLFQSVRYQSESLWREFFDRHCIITSPQSFEIQAQQRTTSATITHALRKKNVDGINQSYLKFISSFYKGVNSYVSPTHYAAMWQFILAQPWGKLVTEPSFHIPSSLVTGWKPHPELVAPNTFIQNIENFIKQTAPPTKDAHLEDLPRESFPSPQLEFSIDNRSIPPIKTVTFEEWEQTVQTRSSDQVQALVETWKNLTNSPLKLQEWSIAGETWYGLSFPPLNGSQLLRLLTATAPLSFQNDDGTLNVLEATESDFRLKDEEKELKDLHRHIPGMSLFDLQRSDYLATLQPNMELLQIQNLTNSILRKLFNFIFHSSPVAFPEILNYLQCSGEKISFGSEHQLRLLTALMSQLSATTDAERLKNILEIIHSQGTPGQETFFGTSFKNENSVHFRASAYPPNKKADILIFDPELTAENKIKIDWATGQTTIVSLSRKVGKYTYFLEVGAIKGEIENHSAFDEQESPTMTPFVAWKKGEGRLRWPSVVRQPRGNFTEEELAEKRNSQLLPQEILDYVAEQSATSPHSNLLGGLALATFFSAILTEWRQYTELKAGGQNQEMSEAQVILFPAMFDKQYPDVLNNLEQHLK